jgi:tetratricopeptide (TPR) repeat protein
MTPRAVLVSLALAACAAPTAVLAQSPAPGRVLVIPFENLKGEGRIFWLGEASAVLLTDDLNALGANAITRQERQQAFERLQVPPVAALTDATVLRIGQLVGADRVIVGTLEMIDDVLTVRARSIALDVGRVNGNVIERGGVKDLYATFERVARALAPPSGRTSEEVVRQHPPVAAFENFIKGLLAETPDTAIAYLETALKLQPSFDRARLALWDVYTDQDDAEQALAAVKPVAAASPLARRARFLGGLSQIDLKKLDEALATFKALAAAEPSPAVLNNLGVVQLLRGALLDAGGAAYYFTKATDADPEDSDFAFNLGYTYFLGRDHPAAIYWLRETVRRNPADGVAHYVLGTALAATGGAAEAAREKELARRLSSAFAQWDKRPAAEAVPKGLERRRSDFELPHAGRIEGRLATSEQRDQAELAQFYLESGRRQFEQEHDRDAVADLNRALYLSPYLADAHLLLGRLHLRNGRVREAIDALKISLWSAETAAAHAVLGEAYRQDKNVPAARTEAERALALDPSSIEARQLAARLDRR